MKLTTIKSIVAAALVAVGLAAAAESVYPDRVDKVQLWKGGPFWAECNIGATTPQGYGTLKQFSDTSQAVTDALGADWFVPTAEDFEGLTNDVYCTRAWTDNYNSTGVKGFVVTSKADPTKSIFLPAAGFNAGAQGSEGYYWSSTPNATNSTLATAIKFRKENGVDLFYVTTTQDRGLTMSIRAVRYPPSVIINEEPWESAKGVITVDYSLVRLDAAKRYRVVFDITAGGRTVSVTNAATKLVDGKQPVMTINTVELFGEETIDSNAMLKVTLIEMPPSGQLWKDGPIFAECNVGASNPEDPGYYFWWGDTNGYRRDGTKWVSIVDGTEISFDQAPANSTMSKSISELKSGGWIDENGNLKLEHDAARAKLGEPWRMPTQAEFDKLTNTAYCTSVWTANYNGTGIAGRIVTGATEGYTDNSIFLPASGRGYDTRFDIGTYGVYWSSTPVPETLDDAFAWDLCANSSRFDVGHDFYRSDGCTVRAVMDTEPAELYETSAERTFWLGPSGSKEHPWKVGTEGHEGEVAAYTNGIGGLVVEGAGAVGSMPWAESAAGINELVKQKGVTGLEGIVATLPALTMVNGLTLKELNGLAVGAVKADGFSAIAVDPATQKATLSVVICKAESLEAEWKPVVTNDVPVAADTPAGFFIVAPQVPSNVVPHSPIAFPVFDPEIR